MDFLKENRSPLPMCLCNVWDVASAQAAARAGFTYIGTSSGAIANMLGYNDGEKMSFSELLYWVKRIVKSVNLPLSVDLEAGYSRDTKLIVDHIQTLANLGVVGINLEDSLVINGERSMLTMPHFAQLLTQIKTELNHRAISIFLNVRTDGFLLGNADALTITRLRAQAYQTAGADGIFIPGITALADIKNIIQAIKIPLNVMCMPGLPDFSSLAKVGVKRISMGNFVYNDLQKHLIKRLEQIKMEKSFTSIFAV